METLTNQLRIVFNSELVKWINTGDRIFDNSLVTIIQVGAILLITFICNNLWRLKRNSNPWQFNPNNAPTYEQNGTGVRIKLPCSEQTLAVIMAKHSTLLHDNVYLRLGFNGKNIVETDSSFSTANYNQTTVPIMKLGNYFVYYAFSTLHCRNPHTLLQACLIIKECEKKLNQKIECYNLLYEVNDEGMSTKVGTISGKKNFANLFFEQKQELISIIDKFQTKTMYPSHVAMDNKLGIILYGPPGTGKTATISAICNYLGKDAIFSYCSKGLTCKVFDTLLNQQAEKIVVLDEFDCLPGVLKRGTFHRSEETQPRSDGLVKNYRDLLMFAEGDERKEIINSMKTNFNKSTKEVDLGYILQKLDGIESCEGRIIIAITNHPERLDPALLRPGRFDIKLHLDQCTSEIATDLLCHYFQQERKVLPFDIPNKKYTPVEILNKAMITGNLQDTIDSLP